MKTPVQEQAELVKLKAKEKKSLAYLKYMSVLTVDSERIHAVFSCF